MPPKIFCVKTKKIFVQQIKLIKQKLIKKANYVKINFIIKIWRDTYEKFNELFISNVNGNILAI